jgi:uncharacterized protein YcbX
MSRGRAIGVLREIWRHPVKSLGGESIGETAIARRFGVAGDRAWAIRDLGAGEIRGAKKIPELMMLTARYVEAPSERDSAAVEIDFGDGRLVRSDDPAVAERLTQRLGRAVSLCRRMPADDTAHYRRARPLTDPEAEIREASGLLPGEAVPAVAEAPVDFSPLASYVTPPGTYFDFFDLHLLSTGSLEQFAARVPGASVEARRFRPNLVVELESPRPDEVPGAAGAGPVADWPELAWVGRVMAIGELRFEITMPMMRCGMTTHAQPGLPREPRIMRTLARDCGLNLGAGVTVLQGGRVKPGDTIRIAEP